MLNKLALQNIKGSKGYFIAYIITLGFLMTIIYNLSSLQVQLESLKVFSSTGSGGVSLAGLFNFLRYFMYLVVTAFTAYISRFFIKRRFKEIALLKTMGLDRKKIWSMFLLENIVVCVGGFILGIVMGFLTSRIFNYIAMSIFGFHTSNIPLGFSGQGIRSILLVMVLLYLVMAIIPLKAVQSANVVTLLKGNQVQDEITKPPFVSMILFVLSAIALIFMVVTHKIQELNLAVIVIYMALSIMTAITFYRGFIVFFFYKYQKSNNNLNKPVQTLAMAHLKNSVYALSKMMAFITIMAGFITVFVTLSFGVINTITGQVTNSDIPFSIATANQSDENRVIQAMDRQGIENVSFPLLSTLQTGQDPLSLSAMIVSQSTLEEVASKKNITLTNNVNIATKTDFDCSVDVVVCAVTNNLHLIQVENVGTTLGLIEREGMINIYSEEEPQFVISRHFETPLVIVVSDSEYQTLAQNPEMTQLYFVSGLTPVTRNDIFTYNNFMDDINLMEDSSLAVTNFWALEAIYNNISFGLFQVVFLLMSIVVLIALMMAIFFRTLENMELGVNDYVISKQIGLTRKQIFQATSLEALITQVLPFIVGSIGGLVLLNPMLSATSSEGPNILHYFVEPTNMMIFTIFGIVLITLLVIIVYSINNRINAFKKLV